MSIYLKIKLKSLAAEACIIRQQEQKMRGPIWGPKSSGLTLHRKGVVRSEARHTHLAYGYIRGKKLSEIEAFSHTVPDWSKVYRMICKYDTTTEKDFKEWKSEDRVPRKKVA